MNAWQIMVAKADWLALRATIRLQIERGRPFPVRAR